jgi:hypothetical protein
MPSCTNKQRTQDQVLIQQILFYITSLYSHLAYGKGLLAIVVSLWTHMTNPCTVYGHRRRPWSYTKAAKIIATFVSLFQSLIVSNKRR